MKIMILELPDFHHPVKRIFTPCKIWNCLDGPVHYLEKTWFSQDQRHHVKSNQLLCGRENWHHENLQQNIKCWSWHTQVPSDSSHSSTSASLSTVSTCVVVKSNGTLIGGGTCHKHHPCCQMVGEIAHLYLKCLVHCVTDTWCADVRQTIKCRTRRN
jgi:hypothetical protein